jgi:hypothetical protein
MCDSNSSIDSQIEYIKYFETDYDRETGINHKIYSVVRVIQETNDFTYLQQLIDAIKFIRSSKSSRSINGLRDLSYSALFTIHSYYPNIAISVLKSFVLHDSCNASIGSWKDVRNYANFCKKYNANIYANSALCLYNQQLRIDYELYMKYKTDDICPRNYLSFAAKYAPRESKDAESFNALVCDWFSLKMAVQLTNWHKMSYRKIVSTLNKAIDTLEIHLCDRDLTNVYGSKIPYVAFELNRENLTEKTESLRKYYSDSNISHYFLQNPWKIIKNVFCAKNNRETIDKMNHYWKLRVPTDIIANYYIPILNLSPSMCVTQRRLCNAIAIAMKYAEKSYFGNRILTFSQKVVWTDLTDCDLNIALERLMSATMNIQGCVCCVMNLLLGAMKESGMIEDDLEKIKIIMITNATTSETEFAEFQKLWSSVGKLNNDNFIQIVL